MKEPQKIRVFKYMKKEGSITQMEAFSRLHIVNLPGRIYDLRHDGVLIDKFHVTEKKDGDRVDYDRYFVAADNQVDPTNQEKQSGNSKARSEDIPCPVQAVP